MLNWKMIMFLIMSGRDRKMNNLSKKDFSCSISIPSSKIERFQFCHEFPEKRSFEVSLLI